MSHQSEEKNGDRMEEKRHSNASSSQENLEEPVTSHGKKVQKEKQHKTIATTIDVFDKILELAVESHITGRELFDQVANQLKLKEVWFFGLLFTDSKGTETWLKLKKKILAQDVGKKRPIHVSFRAKFYPEDVAKELMDTVSQRIFFEQVKQQILNGDIYCPIDTAVLLASYALQEKYGNFNAVLQPKGFLAEQTILPEKITEQYEFTEQQWEDRVVTFYKDHRDMNKEQSMMEYLKIAQDLEMFGIDYFAIKNKKGTDLYLGVDALGLNVYETENKLAPKMGFPWDEILSISFKDKRFTINPIDVKAPSFVFLATKSRVNKKILALCMGNHELFVRRRKTHVAPSQRSSGASSSARYSGANTFSLEEKSSRTNKRTYEVTRTSVHENGKHKSIREPDQYEPVETRRASADIHTADETFRMSRTPSPPPDQFDRTKTPSPQADLYRAKTPSPEPPEDYDEPIDKNRLERTNSPKNKHRSVRYSSSVAEDNTLLYEQINTVNRSSHVHSDSSDIPESPNFPSSEAKDEKSLFEITAADQYNEGMVEYATILPRSKGPVKEDYVPERRLYMPQNRRTYQRLVELFEEMSHAQTAMRPEDMYYQELKASGTDKYKTLKHIRSGYAKDRVALFEAL